MSDYALEPHISASVAVWKQEARQRFGGLIAWLNRKMGKEDLPFIGL